jgi:hypothetical protein
MEKITLRLVAVLIGIALTSAASITNAGVFYSNDFESAVGPEWSNTSTDLTPVGNRRFLGQFGNDIVSLSLHNLPAHEEVTVSFDLFVIRSWDGIGNLTGGPDVWELGVANGLILLNQTLLHTTFSNTEEVGNLQSYPDFHPGGVYPGGTGAAEKDTLGYNLYGDSVYALSYTFSHSNSSLSLYFLAYGLQELSDESWGIDNVTVIPEPATICLLGLGALSLLRRKR